MPTFIKFLEVILPKSTYEPLNHLLDFTHIGKTWFFAQIALFTFAFLLGIAIRTRKPFATTLAGTITIILLAWHSLIAYALTTYMRTPNALAKLPWLPENTTDAQLSFGGILILVVGIGLMALLLGHKIAGPKKPSKKKFA